MQVNMDNKKTQDRKRINRKKEREDWRKSERERERERVRENNLSEFLLVAIIKEMNNGVRRSRCSKSQNEKVKDELKGYRQRQRQEESEKDIFDGRKKVCYVV